MEHSLSPLNYHRRMRDYLLAEHRELWEWFASIEGKSDYTEAVELHLLKTTYRLEREAHRDLYEAADEVSLALGLAIPVTLYQAQGGAGNSAALYDTPGHGHIVFIGGLLELLDLPEKRAILGHELAHFKLWREDSGRHLVADQVLTAMVNEPRADETHFQSARLHRLYTEIYADQGALLVTDEKTTISALLKVHTGMKTANPESYLKQAEELFRKGQFSTEGSTHPELFIRVRAIQKTSSGEDQTEVEEEINRLIEGEMKLDEMDFLSQQSLLGHTKAFLQAHLKEEWLQTDTILAHASLFFHDFRESLASPGTFVLNLGGVDKKIRDYFCYLLVDFAVADRELDENSIAASFVTAESFAIADALEPLMREELKLRKKDVIRIRKEATETVSKAMREHEQGGGHAA
ncbi:MAG: hypothetical protein ACJAVK_000266 [Akkermansiaceae bacterium]|jgi:hypothetical protein